MSFSSYIYFFLYLLKDRGVLERLQPSLVAISQDLKEEKFNKGKYRFFLYYFHCFIVVVVDDDAMRWENTYSIK